MTEPWRSARLRMLRMPILFLVLFCAVGRAVAQEDSSSPGLPEIGRSILQEISPLLLPKVVGDCALLKMYIRSEEYADVRKQYGDLQSVDAVYTRALELSWGNIAEALLISFVATMDHQRFGVHLPVLGPLLWFPLTSEFSDDFAMRLHALPTHLYPDTPHNREGDRDKLQHFFGSAYLAYSLESDDPAERVGDFVEWGEERFIVGGLNDVRDKRSNSHGRRFGLRLRQDETVTPTEFMLLTSSEAIDIVPGGCVPGLDGVGSEGQ